MEIFNWEIHFKDFGKVKVKVNMSPETYDQMISKIPQSSINWMKEQPKKFGTNWTMGENHKKRITWVEKQLFLLFKLDVLYSNWLYIITH